MKIAKPIITMLAAVFGLATWGQTTLNELLPLGASPAAPASSVGALGTESADTGVVYGGGLGGGAPRVAASQVSVLCFKEPDQEKISETMEDVAVLAFLLSRNLEHSSANDAADYKMGIPMLLTSDSQVGASYIQGFGAILKMQVRFPLVSSPDTSDQADTGKQGSEWEEARRELMAKDNPRSSYWITRSAFSPYDSGGPPYNARLVETFKKRVLALLKNASNLRHVDGNEWIMVKVVGPPCSSTGSRNFEDASEGKETAANNAGGKERPGQPRTSNRSLANSNQATVLAMRVKKSAVDAFAGGTLSEEQFIKGAEVAAYLNPVQYEAEAKAAKR